MLKPLSYDAVRTLYDAQGYPIRKDGIDVFGIRSKDMTPDLWNDTIGSINHITKKVISLSGTTDPGKSPLSKTEGINVNGIFILLAGHYPDCFMKGFHKGKYKALIQAVDGLFRGIRDNNHDGKIDMTGKIVTDVRGLNLHTTRWDKKVMHVGDFSEACQVVAVAKEYDVLMEEVYASKQKRYSYALFEN